MPTPTRLPLILQISILRKILLLNDGRDKLLKIIQYSAKFATFIREIHIPTKQISGISIHPNSIKNLISTLSVSRRIIRLGHFLEPLHELTSPTTLPKNATAWKKTRHSLQTLNNAIGVINDITDDIICLVKINVLKTKDLQQFERVSERLWFTTIFVDLVESLFVLMEYYSLRSEFVESARKQRVKMLEVSKRQVGSRGEKNPVVYEFKTEFDEKIAKVDEKLVMQKLSIVKLLSDGVFCGFDVCKLGHLGWSDGWQITSGLVSGLLSTYKLYVKNA
ncbi:hypothetical protein HK098_002642 [Nowakowskiella sp. JEL0407]|nr:hypothetical protein HK098_002642 [Nowakowskiella sp. JEL0407]